MSAPKPDNQPSLTQWAHQVIGLDTVQVKVRLRGNDLHILCEGQECPDEALILKRLILALQSTSLEALTPASHPQIYQVFLYGRTVGQKLPKWLQRIYLNQLERHLEQLKQADPEFGVVGAGFSSPSGGPQGDLLNPPVPEFGVGMDLAEPASELCNASPQPPHNNTATDGALIVSNRSLARQGQPDAIARYLSETLSTLEVGVRVKVKRQKSPPPPAPTPNSELRTPNSELSNHNEAFPQPFGRLWIFCESAYTPDASLLAEPISQQLRDLELQGFRDAVIVSQVSGEKTLDWMLRVDLTPPGEMLREWAHWGDVQALARLVNQALLPASIEARAVIKESTLHLFCQILGGRPSPIEPDKHLCLDAIAPLLQTLAPQGIHAATVYGQIQSQSTPAWVAWLDLPAQIHPALRESALALAAVGDEPAIAFLLSRLLNPDLDWRLVTGGIRVVIRRKADLLHVMSDAPVCPVQSEVGPPVAKFLRSLKIPGIAGVRVYGRRAGQKQPFWSYGVDFKPRKRLVPEPTPEFAASDAYVGELLTQSIARELRPDLTPERVRDTLRQTLRTWGKTVRVFLLRSQLFCEHLETLPATPVPTPTSRQGVKVASLWVTLGLVLTLQADWLMNQILTRQSLLSETASPAKQTRGQQLTDTLDEQGDAPFASSRSKSPALKKSQTDEKWVFNASGFTQAEPLKQRANATAILLAARSRLPSLNSRLLDQQLALYQQYVAETGPPDVLIIGSSRALRGVDPAALSKALAVRGYPKIEAFNFGVNGATAQVVDFIIRQVLTPSQLPKLILWADGSRAFNSGRVDVTYNGIAASDGYKQLLEQKLLTTGDNDLSHPSAALVAPSGVPLPTLASDSPIRGSKLEEPANATSYQTVNQWFERVLAKFSATYPKRDRLRSLLVQQLNLPFASDRAPTLKTPNKAASASGEEVNFDAVEFDGFLPLSIHFNPTTYYQKHPKVPGDYDSDYESFELGGKQDAAMQALLQFTQTHHLPLVFVNLPLTQNYLDSVRTEYERTFGQYMLRLATHRGLVYRDLSQLWPTQNDYFSDPSHLNRYGAYEVSNHLAQDPMIPWPHK